jgi:hypothetical protein
MPHPGKINHDVYTIIKVNRTFCVIPEREQTRYRRTYRSAGKVQRRLSLQFRINQIIVFPALFNINNARPPGIIEPRSSNKRRYGNGNEGPTTLG